MSMHISRKGNTIAAMMQLLNSYRSEKSGTLGSQGIVFLDIVSCILWALMALGLDFPFSLGLRRITLFVVWSNSIHKFTFGTDLQSILLVKILH